MLCNIQTFLVLPKHARADGAKDLSGNRYRISTCIMDGATYFVLWGRAA